MSSSKSLSPMYSGLLRELRKAGFSRSVKLGQGELAQVSHKGEKVWALENTYQGRSLAEIAAQVKPAVNKALRESPIDKGAMVYLTVREPQSVDGKIIAYIGIAVTAP